MYVAYLLMATTGSEQGKGIGERQQWNSLFFLSLAGQGWRNFPCVRWTLRKDAVHEPFYCYPSCEACPMGAPAASDCGSHVRREAEGIGIRLKPRWPSCQWTVYPLPPRAHRHASGDSACGYLGWRGQWWSVSVNQRSSDNRWRENCFVKRYYLFSFPS